MLWCFLVAVAYSVHVEQLYNTLLLGLKAGLHSFPFDERGCQALNAVEMACARVLWIVNKGCNVFNQK